MQLMTKLALFALALCGSGLTGCASDELIAPNLGDNKLYSQCTHGLVKIYSAVATHKKNIPPKLKQQLVSLLIAAEIDSQVKSYPLCLDKLERAQVFLQQAKL